MTLIRLPAGLRHGTVEREEGRKEERREETEAERAAVTDKEDVAGAKD